MEEIILEIMKELFELGSVDASVSQKSCEKWDSMGHLNLIFRLESAFDISLEPEEISEMVSFRDVIRIMASKGIKA